MNFYRIKEEANKLLLYQKRLDTHFDVRELQFPEKRIMFDSLQNYASVTGLPLSILLHDRTSPIRDGVRIYVPEHDLHLILYNEDICCAERLRFTLAHETAHVVLEHTEECEKAELEADFFAAQLLSPWFTIKMLGDVVKPTASQLSAIFHISTASANRRISEMYKIRHILTESDKRVYDLQREQAHRIFNETYKRKRRISYG